MPQTKTERKSIAILLSALNSPFHKQALLGAADAAEKRDYNFFAFTGAPLNTTSGFGRTRNLLYDIINPELVHGLLVPVSSLARFTHPDLFRLFLKRFDPMPIVTIGSEIRDYPCVKPDYKSGMEDLLKHIIETHRKTRIVLVRGPFNNSSSNERQLVFEAMLKKYNIPFDGKNIITTDLSVQSAWEALWSLWKGEKEIDAIVTVNDGVAINIIKELKNKKIQVPDEVIVTGFQGRHEGIFSSPSLTTCDEDSYMQGYLAAEKLINIMEGKPVDKITLISTNLIVRQSCGCGKDEDLKYLQISAAKSRLSPDIQYQIDNLYDELSRQVFLPSDPHAQSNFKASLKSLLYSDRLKTQIELNRIITMIRNAGTCLAFNADLHGAVEIISENLNMRHCFIVQFRSNKPPFTTGQITMALCDNEFINLADAETDFPISTMLPAKLLPREQRYSFIVEPLYFREFGLGYVLFELCSREGSLYETLQFQLSSSIFTEKQYEEVSLAEERFSDIAFSISDWLWEVNNELVFTYCSKEAEAVIGYPLKEILGKSLFAFLRPDQEKYLAFVKDNLIANRRRMMNIENWNLAKDGREIGLLISGTPIFDGHNNFKGYRGAFKDITENKRAEEKITYMAYYDQLTGLPNRSLFCDHLRLAISGAQRDNFTAAVLFLDLDRFKIVNDTLGHKFGDKLLLAVAEKIKQSIRETDILSRSGGDEFVVLIPKITEGEIIVQIAKKILSLFKKPIFIDNQAFYITTSIGIAMYPLDGKDVENLLKKADAAMYTAKEKGRNRFHFYDSEMEAKARRRMELENKMYTALVENHFIIHYQPKISCLKETLIGFEALIRWNDPEEGLIPPLEFISIAEDNGLIDPIGKQVLRMAIEKIKEWQKYTDLLVPISINLSARQFNDKNLAMNLIEIIEQGQVDPDLVEFEITENAIIENEAMALETIGILKNYGVKFSLDDFGTGYSSLSYLQKLPIDTVKIDKSFIHSLLKSPQKQVITKTIINMAHTLNLMVIAEGVETSDELKTLREWGCDAIQGYYYSKPLPADEIEKKYFSSPTGPQNKSNSTD